MFAVLWLPVHVHLLVAYYGTLPSHEAYEVCLCHNFDHSFVKDVFVDADDGVTIVVTLVALLSLLSLLLSLKSFVGTKDKTFDSGH